MNSTNGENSMDTKVNTYRTTAKVVGALYILGFVVGIAGSALGTPGQLDMVSAMSMIIAIGALLWVRFGFAIAFNSFQTVFPLYVLHKFGLGAQQTGYILAYMGIILVAMQGGAIGPLSMYFKEANLIVTFLAFALVGMIGWTFASTIPFLLVAMFPMAVGAGSFNALINSAISKAVTRDEVGGMLGLGAGLESATRVVMPALASYLLGAYGPSTPGYMGSLVLAIVVVYAYLNLIVKSNFGG